MAHSLRLAFPSLGDLLGKKGNEELMGKGTGVEKVFRSRRKTPNLGITIMWTKGVQEKALSV